MNPMQPPTLYRQSLVQTAIDPAGPHVELNIPHAIRFQSEDEFKAWLQGQERQCRWNKGRAITPAYLDAERERQRRIREQRHGRQIDDADERGNRVDRNFAKQITYKCASAGSYKTAEIDRRRQAHRAKVGEVEPRNGKPSTKCECDAKMVVVHYNDHTVSVEYHWEHTNHDIYSIEHFRRQGLSKEARAYIENLLRLYPGTEKKTVRRYLAVPDDAIDDLTAHLDIAGLIELMDGRPPGDTMLMGHRIKTMDVFNAARRVKCQTIRPLVDSTQPGATNLSLELQMIALHGKGWRAHKGVAIPGNAQEPEKYWVGLIAPWQIMGLHAYGRKVCMDSTHNTGRGFTGEKIYLYTLVLRNKQTGGLTPGAWMLSNSEQHQPVKEWLIWLRLELDYQPEYFVIDMSPTEARAITDAYPGREDRARPKLHWCLTHVRKAWLDNLKRVPVEGILDGYGVAHERVMNQLRILVDVDDEATFNEQYFRMRQDWDDLGYADWIRYFEGWYMPFKQYWAGPWRKHCSYGLDTNNHIESFHNFLKGNYIGPDKRQPLDFLVHTLTRTVGVSGMGEMQAYMLITNPVGEVSTHFYSKWQAACSGATMRPPTAKEKKAKDKVHLLTPEELIPFITMINDEEARVRSLTDPEDAVYILTITVARKRVHTCSCPAFQPWHELCKHIYTFLRCYPNFYYYDRHWDRALPPHIVGPAVGPDPGPQGNVQGAPHQMGEGMRNNDNALDAQRPAQQQVDRPPAPPADGINPAPPPPLQGYRDAAVARVDALYQSALDNIERQRGQIELVQAHLRARGQEGGVRRAFSVNQLEALIQSCESNRRHVAGLLEGDD